MNFEIEEERLKIVKLYPPVIQYMNKPSEQI